MGITMETPIANEWFVLKGETQYGPYSYEETIRMLQNKHLFGFDYAWASHLTAWTPFADLHEFSVSRLSDLAQKNVLENVFNRRQHERVLVNLPVYVHDQNKFWQGQAHNLSEGGALILMKNPTLLPGDLVHLHFRSRTLTETAFNVTAEILSKRLVKDRIQYNTGIHYAVRFLQKPEAGDQQIKKWIQESKEKNTVKGDLS